MPTLGLHRLWETAFVAVLFLSYLVLWRRKRTRDRQRTGVDPEVLHAATTPLQRYFAALLRLLTRVVVALVVLHALAPETWPPLVRLSALRSAWFDVAGLASGVGGLSLCASAQVTMGSSWRVGIDTERPTTLVTSGLYRFIRNPTYLGLHLMNLGMWIIWPTTLVAAFAVLFFVVMDLQVRAEEEHLVGLHGEAFRAYATTSWRYLPWIY